MRPDDAIERAAKVMHDKLCLTDWKDESEYYKDNMRDIVKLVLKTVHDHGSVSIEVPTAELGAMP